MSEVCINDLKKYIACFNHGSLEGIRERLDENLQIFVNSKLAAQGRDAILPSYQKDFEIGKQVAITKEPIIVENTNPEEVSIRVALEATASNETTCIDVVYTYHSATMKQVRHEIFV